MDDIILSMGMLRNQPKNLKENVRLDDDQAPFGPRVHIDVQAWVVHLIVYAIRHLRGEQLCKIVPFSKSDSDFN